MSTLAVDPEALLVALVLDPATYSRNRFFEMYTDPEIRRVRRRAQLVRGIVRHMSQLSEEERTRTLSIEPPTGDEAELEGMVRIRYEVPSLGLRRTFLLDATELALVRFALASRAANRPDCDDSDERGPDDADREVIEEALRRLAG